MSLYKFTAADTAAYIDMGGLGSRRAEDVRGNR